MKSARPCYLSLGRYALLLWGATSPVKAQLPSSCPVTITATQTVTTYPPDYTGSYTLNGITAIPYSPSISLPIVTTVPTSLIGIDISDSKNQTPAIGISTNVIPGVSIETGIPATTLPAASISIPIGIGATAAPTSSATVLPSSSSLACNSTHQSYTYVDPSSGSQYIVECNTTYSGGLLEVTLTTDISICIAECSRQELCQGVGYDTSTAACSKYLSQVPDSGVYSPTVQFVRPAKRPVVVGGSTLLEAISTSFVSSGINVQGSLTFTYAPPTISIVTPTSLPAVSIPFSYLEITTALPSSPLEITTALPVSSLGISDVLPSSYLDVTTALPVSSLDISTALPSPSLDIATALPLPSLDISSALPFSFSVPILEPGTTGESTSIPSIPPPSIPAVQTLASAIPTSVVPLQTSYSELVCPADDGQLVSENGPTYVVGCEKGVSGVPYSADQASNSFNDCFTECDESSTTQGAQYCTAFLYLGAANGDGMGTCYLYNDVGAAFFGGNSSAVAAIRLANYVAGIPGGISASVSAGLSASLGGLPTTLIPSDQATGSLDLPITLPTDPGASVINSLAIPTATCTNGGNILNGCVIAQVTADPSVGVGVGVGVGGPNSTIIDIQASVTAAASLSLGASAGVGLGLDSSGLSASLGLYWRGIASHVEREQDYNRDPSHYRGIDYDNHFLQHCRRGFDLFQYPTVGHTERVELCIRLSDKSQLFSSWIPFRIAKQFIYNVAADLFLHLLDTHTSCERERRVDYKHNFRIDLLGSKHRRDCILWWLGEWRSAGLCQSSVVRGWSDLLSSVHTTMAKPDATNV
ncbi:hypothetical protein KC318_g2113 [Hortaea werneckii]|nr:hypothetical protein KC334_g2260 [Hortaea werneckii]KAI7022198.1 hypothetical protein KC355_g2146 [Hortaea werneckii]KAI7673634.1 hypothetical protein KC318_g2113 [Hortaea werneckii]